MPVIVGASGTGAEGKSDRMGLPTGTSDPGSASAGDMYFKTDTNKVRVYDGSAWSDMGTGGVAYTSGSGSGLIFDCDFGRLTGFSDGGAIADGTDLSDALEHSTTDWSSSSSNTPLDMNSGSCNFKTANGGHIDTYTNQGRIYASAGSGNPAMSDKLNTAAMSIEGWYMYDGSQRDVLVSRWGGSDPNTGVSHPNQFNHIVDPGGQFHYNSSGVGAGSGNEDWDSFGDNVWFHCIWQYANGTHEWWVNNTQKGTVTGAGTSLAVGSNTGFGIASRADRYEDLEGKIAIVRIYNRLLTSSEISTHWNNEKGRFGL